ncbi:MAG: T9SS type A sorting domain-containing protein [Bacteroidetes bacterium]|nr:T9SS type A sorting domain-containing protein [Bacteroidota bacterium]
MRRLHLLFFLLCLLPVSSQAADYLWTGAEDSLWSNLNNWEVASLVPAVLPGPTDNVEILGPSTRRPYVDIVDATCLNFYIEFDELVVNIGQQLSIYGNLQLGDAGDVRLLSNARLQIAGNLDNSLSNGNIFSQPGSRVVFFGPGNSAIINPITLFDVTINKSASARVYNQPRCLNGTVGTPIVITNNLTIDKGVLALADVDGADNNPELAVTGNITINNGGCLDLSGFIDNNLGCGAVLPQRIRVNLGGNLADNTAPFPPTNVRGFFIGSVVRMGTSGNRPLLVFNGVKDQTVLGQYPLTNAADVANQGSGIWLPRVIVDKPDPTKRVAMLTNVRLYGNAQIRSGIWLLNSKNLLYGENNGNTLDIRDNGTLHANDGSVLQMMTSSGDGTFLRVFAGGHLKMVGSAAQRITITRDAATPGQYYRTAVYNTGRVSMRYVDFNFQGTSNTGFNNDGLLGSACDCTNNTSPCYTSQGGMKVFAGAVLDPDGVGNNFSDCAFSAGGSGYTALTLNVAGTHVIENVVFNGANQASVLNNEFGIPAGGTGATTLCNGGTSSPTNACSNNASTTLRLVNSSGLIGGEIFGEGYDTGLRDYREFVTPNFIYRDNASRIPLVNDHIVFEGRPVAIWIGRGNNDNWNNIDNWSTKEISATAIPGTAGNENYTVIIPKGSRLPSLGGTGNGNVLQNINVNIRGALYENLEYTLPAKYLDTSLGIYPGGSTYTQGTGNRRLQVNSNRNLDIDGDLFIMNDGTITMQNTAPHPTMNVGGNLFMHFANATFTANQSTVTLDGLSVQQLRTRTGQDGTNYPNTTNAFNHLIVNKPSSTVFVQNNNLTVRGNLTNTAGNMELFTGLCLRVDGDFTFTSGAHIWNFSTVFFSGNFYNDGGTIMPERSCIMFMSPTGTTRTIRTNNQPFNYCLFAGAGTGTYNLEGNLNILNSDNTTTPDMGSWFTDNSYNQCRIRTGKTLNLNGNVMRTHRFIVDAGAILNVNPGTGVRGAELLVYGGDDPVTYASETDNKFIVNGRINIIGTSARTSKISRNGIIGRYGIDINGTISARYALFELADVNGFDCRDATTIVDPATGIGCFSNSIFTNGDPTAGSYLLRLPNTWAGTTNITEASFPANSGASTFNVSRVSTGGPTSITFVNPSGVFAGEDFDDDTGGVNRVAWSISNQFRWDGGGDGVSWHSANNWCPNGVPGVGLNVNADVILDHTGCSIAPTMNITLNGADVVLRDLTISPGAGNPIRLAVHSNLTVGGQFTNKQKGTFNIVSATPTITFRRNFSNEGQFYNGGGTATLRFQGIGTNVIYNEPHDNYPFRNLLIMEGVYELNSEITVERTVEIMADGILDASNDNNRLNVAFNWHDDGEFECRYGTVAFVDLPAHSEPVGASTASYAQIAESTQFITYTGADLHETFFNMVLDKYLSPSTHHVQLLDPLLIDGVLDLRQRNLITNYYFSALPGYIRQEFNNIAILGLFGSWTNASAGSFVDGPLARTYISNVPFNYDFPIGKFQEYVKPVELEIQLATNGPAITRFAMEQFNQPIDTVDRSVPDPCVSPSLGLKLALLPRFWNVARLYGALGGTANLAQGNIKLVWDNDDGLTESFENVRVVKDAGTNPNGHDLKTLADLADFSTVNCPPATAQLNGNEQGGEALTLPGFFTLGNGDFGLVFFDNILPVETLDFQAKYAGSGTQLLWNTRGEINNEGFVLLRAADEPYGFMQIASHNSLPALKGQGTTNAPAAYSYYDSYALQPGKTYYYQLLSQDINGAVHNHGVRSVTLPMGYALGTPYPNPHNTSARVNYAIADDVPVTLTVYNTQGQQVAVLLQNQPLKAGSYTADVLLPNMPAGVYVLRMQAGTYDKTTRFIKQ